MKLMKREDFPPTVPPEVVDRVLALAKGSRRAALPSRIVMWSSVVAGFGVMGSAFMFGWPIWAHTLALVIVAAGGKLSQVLQVRSSQAELVRVGTKCPKCQQPVHRSGLSSAEAQEDWRTVMGGYCPRCFAQIGPNVLATGA